MIVVLLACADPNPDPAEAKLGERLFVEPRFAQRFAAEAGDALNSPLAEGDPVLDVEVRDGGDVPGPFAGSTMSCRQCHLVDDVTANVGASVRTYADFARRSPIPDRGDGLHETVRNSPSLVDMSIARDTPFLLHFDGEFDSPAALVRGTFTGRNLGWLADEHGAAVAHVAAVVRADDGTFPVYTEGATIPYATLLAGTDPDIPAALRIPEELRVDVDSATDEEVLDAVAALVGAYLENIQFSRGLESGLHDGSPYDAFLVANDLPRAPTDGETVEAYTTRLRDAVGALGDPVWISEVDGMLALHDHPFQFGEAELRGLRTFLATPGTTVGSVGNCASCHAPPVFSDFGLHNTGVSQREYDAIWGEGAFVALAIPDLDTRAADPAPWLPASPAHPDWRGAMKAVPSADDPGLADLGAWSIYANDDHPDVQDSLTTLLDGDTDATRLDSAVAAFKTPSVRDLGQSAPYLHDGGAASLDEVIEHYRVVSNLARAGTLRNADPELAGITLTDADAADLRAFLQALDEDYD